MGGRGRATTGALGGCNISIWRTQNMEMMHWGVYHPAWVSRSRLRAGESREVHGVGRISSVTASVFFVMDIYQHVLCQRSDQHG